MAGKGKKSPVEIVIGGMKGRTVTTSGGHKMFVPDDPAPLPLSYHKAQKPGQKDPRGTPDE